MGHPSITARDDFAGVKCTNPCAKCNLQKIYGLDLQAAVYPLDPDAVYCMESDGSKTEDAAGNWRLVNICPVSHAAIWMQSYVSISIYFLFLLSSGRKIVQLFFFSLLLLFFSALNFRPVSINFYWSASYRSKEYGVSPDCRFGKQPALSIWHVKR